ncbi:MAG TPA: cutinase family protein [Mycobacterium sp.]|nr:cutinase family protein [Mycobacterium sp.]HUH71619.1 cutinase family protein [Mycobacterium sp.]
MRAHRIARVLGVSVAITPALLSGPVGIPSAYADPCPNAEVVFARGTGEPPGVGKVGQSFVDSLRSQVNGRSLGVYPVDYPATQAFAASANDGANDASAHVQDMVARCPNTRMVLGGFSQGAGVIDLATAALPPPAADHVAAVALFGNPSSALASSLAGIAFPAIGPLYSSKTIDQCAPDDPACSGGLNPLAHGSYVQSGMTSQAATFVAGRLS